MIEFAGRPMASSTQAADSVTHLEPSATNIEAALEAALAAHAEAAFTSVVMVSDGLENVGDAARALRALRASSVAAAMDRRSSAAAADACRRGAGAAACAGRPAHPDHRAIGGAVGQAATRQGHRAHHERRRPRLRAATADGRRPGDDRVRRRAAPAPFSWTSRWRILLRDKPSDAWPDAAVVDVVAARGHPVCAGVDRALLHAACCSGGWTLRCDACCAASTPRPTRSTATRRSCSTTWPSPTPARDSGMRWWPP